jgi:hypothetical protein
VLAFLRASGVADNPASPRPSLAAEAIIQDRPAKIEVMAPELANQFGRQAERLRGQNDRSKEQDELVDFFRADGVSPQRACGSQYRRLEVDFFGCYARQSNTASLAVKERILLGVSAQEVDACWKNLLNRQTGAAIILSLGAVYAWQRPANVCVGGAGCNPTWAERGAVSYFAVSAPGAPQDIGGAVSRATKPANAHQAPGLLTTGTGLYPVANRPFDCDRAGLAGRSQQIIDGDRNQIVHRTMITQGKYTQLADDFRRRRKGRSNCGPFLLFRYLPIAGPRKAGFGGPLDGCRECLGIGPF